MQVPIPIFLDKYPKQLSEGREESKIIYMYNNICNMHDSKKKQQQIHQQIARSVIGLVPGESVCARWYEKIVKY